MLGSIRSDAERALTAVMLLAALAMACGGPAPGPPKAVLVDGIGGWGRAISTDSPHAQQLFDQGLRLTYGYYFPEAAASFQEALRHDAHPMIYWGLALAIGPSPNSRYRGFPDDPTGDGRAAIEQAAELGATASDAERAFIDALLVRYDKETHPDTATRDRAYAQQARLLAERYPLDDDALTLYADALMTASAWSYWDRDGEPLPGTLEAGEALERVMERSPGHPGANHLYIHLLEASLRPEQALPQADRLAGLMPKAGHIVHMPSHIYVRVGDYAKAIATNEQSIAADRAFLSAWGDTPFPANTTYPLSSQIHATHAYDFIRYTATIQGSYAKALETARAARQVALDRMGVKPGRAQRAIAAVWLVHKIFGQWDALLAEPGPPGQGYPYLDGIWYYTRGSAHAARGDLARAREELARLRAAAAAPGLSSLVVMANPAATVLELAALGLEGEITQAAGDLEGAIAAFEAATRAEATLGYVEPPDWPQPMRHYLGAALLEAERPADAERVYRDDLRWNHENGWALVGLSRSLTDQGRATEAAEVHGRFLRAWRSADVALEASRF